MKNALLSSGMILVFTLFLASCASTKLMNPWRDNSFEGPVKKIFVVAGVQNRERRVMIENQFVEQFKSRGTEAVGSSVFFFENTPPTKEALEPKVKESGADALLMIQFVKRETVESYMPPANSGVPVTFDANPFSSFQFPETSEQNITYEFNRVVMQLTLYEVSTGKPIWASGTETIYQNDGLKNIKPFTRVVRNRLIADGLIK